MSAWLNYIIEANVGLILFLAAYKVLPGSETDFRFKRALLVIGMVASSVFPLLHFQTSAQASALSVDEIISSYVTPQIDVMTSADNAAPEQSFTISQLTSAVYIAGVLIATVLMLFQLGRLFVLMHRSDVRRIGKVWIAESTDDKPTFSFFNFIFIGRVDLLSGNERDQIIRHELVHVTQLHSIDILFLSLLKSLFWFNPMITIYRRALVEAHEFEADARTVVGADAGRYCNLLAKVALHSNGLTLGSYFNHHLTVKRIAMIRSVKTKIAFWKVVFSIALIPFTFFLLSCQDQLKNEGQASEVFSSVDEAATPLGGFEAFYNTIRANLRYPAKARSGHLYGKVSVQFVVNEDGRLSDYQLLESPGQTLGDEAIRVLSLSPPWIPARKAGVAVKQALVLPISFKVDFPGKQKQVPSDEEIKGDPTRVTSPTFIFTPNTKLGEVVVIGYALK